MDIVLSLCAKTRSACGSLAHYISSACVQVCGRIWRVPCFKESNVSQRSQCCHTKRRAEPQYNVIALRTLATRRVCGVDSSGCHAIKPWKRRARAAANKCARTCANAAAMLSYVRAVELCRARHSNQPRRASELCRALLDTTKPSTDMHQPRRQPSCVKALEPR